MATNPNVTKGANVAKVVELANKEVNEANEQKVLVRLREIRNLQEAKAKDNARYDKSIAALQAQIAEIEFDVIKAEDVLGTGAGA